MKRAAQSVRERQKEDALKTELALKRRAQGSVLLSLLQGTVTENRYRDFYQVEGARKRLRTLDPSLTMDEHDEVKLLTSKLNPHEHDPSDKMPPVRPVTPPRVPDLDSFLPEVPSVLHAPSFDRDSNSSISSTTKNANSSREDDFMSQAPSQTIVAPGKSRRQKILDMRARKKEQREIATESARLKQRTLAEILLAAQKDTKIGDKQDLESKQEQATQAALNAEYLDSLLESSDSSDDNNDELVAIPSAPNSAVQLLIAQTRPPPSPSPSSSYSSPSSLGKLPLPPKPPSFYASAYAHQDGEMHLSVTQTNMPAVPPPPGMSTLPNLSVKTPLN